MIVTKTLKEAVIDDACQQYHVLKRDDLMNIANAAQKLCPTIKNWEALFKPIMQDASQDLLFNENHRFIDGTLEKVTDMICQKAPVFKRDDVLNFVRAVQKLCPAVKSWEILVKLILQDASIEAFWNKNYTFADGTLEAREFDIHSIVRASERYRPKTIVFKCEHSGDLDQLYRISSSVTKIVFTHSNIKSVTLGDRVYDRPTH